MIVATGTMARIPVEKGPVEWVNYIIRTTLSTPSPPEEGVQAPVAATIGSKEEENEAKENGRHPLVDNWPCTLWRMCLPVSNRHLARKDECNGMGEEPQENRRATEELKYPCNPQLGRAEPSSYRARRRTSQRVSDLLLGERESQTQSGAERR
jgi:hypothetical protein